MASPPIDRLKLAALRGHNLSKDNEATVVLALNDAAVTSGIGVFFYLPDTLSSPARKSGSLDGVVRREGVVPKLLYANHVWSERGKTAYWDNDDQRRYLFIQGHVSTLLPASKLVPITFAVRDTGVAALSWPRNTDARIVIYVPFGLGKKDNEYEGCKLGWMSEWNANATLNEASDTYTIATFTRQGLSSGNAKKAYGKSASAVGTMRPFGEVPALIREMLDELGRGQPQSPWVAGSAIVAALAPDNVGVQGEQARQEAKGTSLPQEGGAVVKVEELPLKFEAVVKVEE